MTDIDTAREAVYDRICERTEADPDGKQILGTAWTSKRRLEKDAPKDHFDFGPGQLEAALKVLRAQGRVIHWHGQLAPATDEHLRALIQIERDAGFTRKILVGKCNALLHADDSATDSTAAASDQGGESTPSEPSNDDTNTA